MRAGNAIHGTVIRIRTYILNALKPVDAIVVITNGKKKSKITVSFENLVSTLPIGFSSKNTEGALNNFQRAFL